MRKIVLLLLLSLSFETFAVESVSVNLTNPSDTFRLYSNMNLMKVHSVDDDGNQVWTKSYNSSDSALSISCKRIVGVGQRYSCNLNFLIDTERNNVTSIYRAPTGALVAELDESDSQLLFDKVLGVTKVFSSQEKTTTRFNDSDLVVPLVTLECPSEQFKLTGQCKVIVFTQSH